MDQIEDWKHPDNVTIRCTADEFRAMQQEEERKAREAYQGKPQVAALKLHETALHQTSGGRAASGLLLSFWSGRFVCNLQQVMTSLDIDNTQAAHTLLCTLGPGHQLERYLTEDHILQLLDVWGDTHDRERVCA